MLGIIINVLMSEWSCPVKPMIPLSWEGGCYYRSQWENHAPSTPQSLPSNLEAEETPPVSPPPLQLSSYSELRETQTNYRIYCWSFNHFKYGLMYTQALWSQLYFAGNRIGCNLDIRGSERQDGFSGLWRLWRGGNNFFGWYLLWRRSGSPYWKFLFSMFSSFWTLIFEFYKGRGMDFSFNKNSLQSYIHFYVINLSILK